MLRGDGENVLPLAPAQDYKRIFDGDQGPNTGGMGAIRRCRESTRRRRSGSPNESTARSSTRSVAGGTPYHGVLYAGLMLTEAGPKVLEYNVRFGDPETQAVLPRLRSDLLELCLGSRKPGGLGGRQAEFGGDWAVTVVLASAGYPASSSKGGRDHRP